MIYSFALILIILSQFTFSCGKENNAKNISLDTEKWILQKITTGKVPEKVIKKICSFT